MDPSKGYLMALVQESGAIKVYGKFCALESGQLEGLMDDEWQFVFAIQRVSLLAPKELQAPARV